MTHSHAWKYADKEDSGRGRIRTVIIKHECMNCPAVMLTTMYFDGMDVTIPSATVTETNEGDARPTEGGS